MRRALLISLLVALALPAAALATTVYNATLTVKGPYKVKNDWVGAASLKAPSAEQLQLEACIWSNKHTINSSCTTKTVHSKVLAVTTRPASASAPQTWVFAWVFASGSGHHITALS